MGFEQISVYSVLLFSLFVFFAAISVFIRVKKRELPMWLRIVISALAVFLASVYAYRSGRPEDWLLPGVIAVLVLGMIMKLKKLPKE